MSEAEMSDPSNIMPFAFVNWRRVESGVPTEATYEYPLFSDTRIVGEASNGLGPYKLLNNIAFTDDGLLRPAVTLRAGITPWIDEEPQQLITDSRGYHAGDMCDEIAALLSLMLGARFKAGDATREFRPDGDPLGRPISFMAYKGSVSLPLRPSRQRIIPNAVGEHSIVATELLARFVTMSRPDALALVVAARSYQNGLWIADGEPELTWLMFVSALETAAKHWSRVDESPSEKLASSRPELYTTLLSAGGPDLVSRVATDILPSLGVTGRFVKFILQFMPPPREPRPAEFARLKWSKTSLREVMGKVYDHRSRALHEGRPFPMPMCHPPLFRDENGAHAEIPLGLAARTYGGSWLREDTPILLHTFEYITRSVLLNWWRSMIP